MSNAAFILYHQKQIPSHLSVHYSQILGTSTQNCSLYSLHYCYITSSITAPKILILSVNWAI